MSSPSSVSPVRALAIFGVLSLAAVATGCAAAHASGVPIALWVRNPIAWAAGAVTGVLLPCFAGRRAAVGFLAAAPLGLLATLTSSGQSGVHRWLDVGPLHLNAAQVLLPPAIVACATLGGRLWPWIAAACLALLVAQPDASQASAFGAALIVLIGASGASRPMRAGAMVVVSLAVAASWLRRDPLAPVPEVEEIMRLAWAVSPMLAVVAWAALLGAVAALALPRPPEGPAAARALCVYALLSALVPVFGPFPVPLVGVAMSPIIGLWLGAGLLAAAARRRDVSTYSRAAGGA